MLEINELNSTDDPEFQEAVRIYEAVYPPEQRIEPEYFIRSLAGSLDEVTDPNERRAFLVAREESRVRGMATYTYHPHSKFGFLCYLASDPQEPAPEIEDALYKDVLRRVSDEPKSSEEAAIGCVIEVDRPQDAAPSDAQAFQDKIDRLIAAGWLPLDNLDYHMPPLHDGGSPVPLLLMYHPVNDQALDTVMVNHLVLSIYRDVYGLTQDDTLVQQVLQSIK